MKRGQYISALIKEGFSEKTLVKFSDNQIKQLHSRVIREQGYGATSTQTSSSASSKTPNVPHVKAGSPDEKMLKSQGKTYITYEGDMGESKKLTDKQKKIAKKAKPTNVINAKDFEVLRKEKKEKVEESKKDKKWIQKAIDPKKKGSLKKALGVKKDEKIPSGKLQVASKKGGKLGKRARLAKTLKSLNENEMLDFFESVLAKKYHPFTSKSEILNLISEKLNDNKLPDFFTYDAIKKSDKSSDLQEKKNKPKEEPSKPGTKEKEKEKEKKRERPSTPYRTNPDYDPDPKGLKK
jgi:hypothetical protein